MDGFADGSDALPRTSWEQRNYRLDRMDMRALARAYLTYPGVWAYAALLVVLVAATALAPVTAWRAGLSAAAVILLYPVFWYGLHRFVLHGAWLWRHQATAGLWKRIHYDHHREPNDLSVLFGSVGHTVPTVVVLCGPVGWLIGGPDEALGGALVAVATGIAMTLLYEYVHCIQHLGTIPDSAWLRRIKRLHLLHHYHNETGNYGIVSEWPDRLLGSAYGEGRPLRPRSATVRNLGYDEAAARAHPHVAALTPRASFGEDAPA